MKNNQHVVPHPNGWAIKGAKNSKYTKITQTKAEAVKIAERIARNQGTDTKIHNKDGRIASGNSYGNDPFPPLDQR